MTLNEIILLADRAYDEESTLLRHWNLGEACPRSREEIGSFYDGLAYFIVCELHDTVFEEDNEINLQTAFEMMDVAVSQLKHIGKALWRKLDE